MSHLSEVRILIDLNISKQNTCQTQNYVKYQIIYALFVHIFYIFQRSVGKLFLLGMLFSFLLTLPVTVPCIALLYRNLYNCIASISYFFLKCKYFFKNLKKKTDTCTESSAAERLSRILSPLKSLPGSYPFAFLGLFLPWYLFCLSYYPEPLLWWIAVPLSSLLVIISCWFPRSLLFWLPATLLLFNTLYFWLPWPGIKVAFIGPAAACFAAGIASRRGYGP